MIFDKKTIDTKKLVDPKLAVFLVSAAKLCIKHFADVKKLKKGLI